MVFYREKYPTSYILKFIGKDRNIVLDNFKVNLSSLRLKTFKEHGTSCIFCGLQGTHFRIQSHSHNNKENSFHLGLWSDVDKNGKDYELTKDHIIPKSFGGYDSLKNMKTCCSKCNTLKGNSFDIDDFDNGEGKFNFIQALLIKLNKTS